MNNSVFKVDWERFNAHVDVDIALATRLILPYTKNEIKQLTLLSKGCANTNYVLMFKNNRPPVVLRIYVREKSALAREWALYQSFADRIPFPTYLYIDDQCKVYPFPYCIMEWVEGTLMRDVILAQNEKAISECAFEAGQYLNTLRQIKFPYSGFFKKDLQIQPFDKEEKYLSEIFSLLQAPTLRKNLDKNLLLAVSELIENYSYLLPKQEEATLTHADYDPSNIIVNQCKDKWKICAILDWEFSFAGTYLLDVGTMLRYSHKLPTYYENNFVAGIEKNGLPLSDQWKKQAKLMDLLCLLQLANSDSTIERPIMMADITSLIAYTISHWASF